MSSKYQFVTVSAAGWCLGGIQEISGGNLHSHCILNGCWWLWFRVDVKLKKNSILFICQAKGDCQNRCQGVTAAVEPKVSHESQAFKLKSRKSDLM